MDLAATFGWAKVPASHLEWSWLGRRPSHIHLSHSHLSCSSHIHFVCWQRLYADGLGLSVPKIYFNQTHILHSPTPVNYAFWQPLLVRKSLVTSHKIYSATLAVGLPARHERYLSENIDIVDIVAFFAISWRFLAYRPKYRIFLLKYR